MDGIQSAFSGLGGTVLNVYIAILRFAIPALSLLLLYRCIRPLFTFKQEPEIWAWLVTEDGKKLPITHWENVVGRSNRSDVIIDFPTVSKNHAVLTRYDDGSWTVTDTGSKSGVYVNNKRVRICALHEEDVLSLGGIDLKLQPISQRQEAKLAELRTKAGSALDSVASLMILSVIQCLMCLAFLMGGRAEYAKSVVLGFGGIMAAQWLLLGFYACIRRLSYEVETIAFYLCTLGMAAIATVCPGEAIKQVIAMVIGIIVFLTVGWSLRDLERAKVFRYLAAVGGIGFLIITLVFGQEYYGAKNWLVIGGMSLQPSELSKVCFVFVGASTMDRLLNKRNLILFIGYTVAICGCLALMNDFGTALIFFVAFLVIAFLRSGSLGTIGLACTALGFAGVVAIKIAPHALRRFAIWRHIWEDPFGKGYQQTRALMCLTSGGLFGLGAGRGWMHNLFAADSDVVFATITEEWGLLMALTMILCVIALAVFAIRSSMVARSSFYTIGGCTAASILLIQAILNALGTLDVMPLTGVTFPFVSNGGSSIMCAWGLLAFVKAADTRQNASFAVKLHKKGVTEVE